MNYLYLFKGSDDCAMLISLDNKSDVDEIAARNNATAYATSDERHPLSWAKLTGGILVFQEPPPRTLDYREQRAMAYPSMMDQLDAIWQAMDAGLLPKVTGFYDKIAAVKLANPKPGL